ncbi:MAG: hypothetical protein Kow0013_28910 [Pararhodobacter sp.]
MRGRRADENVAARAVPWLWLDAMDGQTIRRTVTHPARFAVVVRRPMEIVMATADLA